MAMPMVDHHHNFVKVYFGVSREISEKLFFSTNFHESKTRFLWIDNGVLRPQAAGERGKQTTAVFDITNPANYTLLNIAPLDTFYDYYDNEYLSMRVITTFNPIRIPSLKTYVDKGWVIPRNIETGRIHPVIYRDLDGKLFFAYNKINKAHTEKEIDVAKTAQVFGFDNLVEVRTLQNGTVLTRIADTYTDEEIVEKHAAIEDLLLLSIAFEALDCWASHSYLNNSYKRSINGRPYYLAYDMNMCFQPLGIAHPLNNYVHGMIIANFSLVENERNDSLNWDYVQSRLNELKTNHSFENIYGLLYSEVETIKTIVRKTLENQDGFKIESKTTLSLDQDSPLNTTLMSSILRPRAAGERRGGAYQNRVSGGALEPSPADATAEERKIDIMISLASEMGMRGLVERFNSGEYGVDEWLIFEDALASRFEVELDSMFRRYKSVSGQLAQIRKRLREEAYRSGDEELGRDRIRSVFQGAISEIEGSI